MITLGSHLKQNNVNVVVVFVAVKAKYFFSNKGVTKTT